MKTVTKATLLRDPTNYYIALVGTSDAPGRNIEMNYGNATSDMRMADRVTHDELAKMGIHLRDTAQPVGTLSGGERQSVAIARAVYFGASMAFGRMQHTDVMRSMALFARDVMPAFR